MPYWAKGSAVLGPVHELCHGPEHPGPARPMSLVMPCRDGQQDQQAVLGHCPRNSCAWPCCAYGPKMHGYFKMGSLLCRIISNTSLFMCKIRVPAVVLFVSTPYPCIIAVAPYPTHTPRSISVRPVNKAS